MNVHYSHSANFAQDELGQMALEVTLEPGDLLYFPRGFTHQVIILGCTPPPSPTCMYMYMYKITNLYSTNSNIQMALMNGVQQHSPRTVFVVFVY